MILPARTRFGSSRHPPRPVAQKQLSYTVLFMFHSSNEQRLAPAPPGAGVHAGAGPPPRGRLDAGAAGRISRASGREAQRHRSGRAGRDEPGERLSLAQGPAASRRRKVTVNENGILRDFRDLSQPLCGERGRDRSSGCPRSALCRALGRLLRLAARLRLAPPQILAERFGEPLLPFFIVAAHVRKTRRGQALAATRLDMAGMLRP